MKKPKNKINIGQCYEKNDHVYMIISGPYTCFNEKPPWEVEETLNKGNYHIFSESLILTLRKPFQNYG